MIAGSSGWSFTATLQATDRSLHISLEVRITQEMFRSSMRSLDSSPETQCTRFSMSSSAHKRRDVSTTFTYKWFYHIYMQTFFFFNPHLPIISWWLVCSILDQKVRCSPGFVTGKSPALLVYWWFIGGKLKGRVVTLLALVLYMESHSLFTGTPGARVYDRSFTFFFYFTPRNIFSEEKEHTCEPVQGCGLWPCCLE